MPQPIEAAVVSTGGNQQGCRPLPSTAKGIHSFSKVIAQEHGVSSALIAAYLAHRIQDTKVNGQRKPYRVNLDELKEHYPYLSRSTISDSLNALVEKHFLTKRNTNRRKYDRTGSYEFTKPTDLNRSKINLIRFETDVATRYGINAAIILNNLKYWLRKNSTKMYHPLSPATLHEHLLFLSERQIKAAIQTLVSNGVISPNPEVPKNRTQQYRLSGAKSGGQFLDDAENSGVTFLDERGQILDMRGTNLDGRGTNLDNDIQLVENVSSLTLKENCFKAPASATPSTYAAISPFEKPLQFPTANTPTPPPQPQAPVARTSTASSPPPHRQSIHPPLPPCSPTPMTESLPASYLEASAEYTEFIKHASLNELLSLQELLLNNYRPFIATADKLWIDRVFVPRTREDLYQHLKPYADHGLPKTLTPDESRNHAKLRPYRVLSLIFLVTGFSYCHPDSRVKTEHHTAVTYDLTLEISKIYDYRKLKLEEHLYQKHSTALAQLEQNRQRHTNDEEDNYLDAYLSPAEKAKVLQHYIDQSNAIGYVDTKAEIKTGALSYTDWDLQAARIFFNTNTDLSAGDIGQVMDRCQVHSKGYEFRKEGCPDMIADGTKLGYTLTHLAQITSYLGITKNMPKFKTMTFRELYPHCRNS